MWENIWIFALWHYVYFFSKNNLLSPNQSRLRSGDSYINQLLLNNHEILSAFDMGLEVCGIFLNICKAFDKVWHDGLIFKLLQNGICSEMTNILERPGYSCINQLLSGNHEILSAFNMGLKVFGIFLDIYKAFDKVWHDGLIFKLHQNGICSEIIIILQDFLSNRKQRVVLNGQCSSWADIHLGVPQGSI